MTKFPFFTKGANPSVDSPFAFKKLAYIEGYMKHGSACWIDPDNHALGAILIDKWATRPNVEIENVGLGNLIPFTRVQNRQQKPESINYPIPAVGANLWQSHHGPVRCQLVNKVPGISAVQ